MNLNLKLLLAIKEMELTQKEFSELVGDHFTFVSRVVNGWVNLDLKRKLKYARVLGKKVEDLFEK